MSNASAKILIVDDEENIRLMLRATLESEGYSVQEATSTAEAIASIEIESPDIVLLDLWMPGANGMIVLEHFAHRLPQHRPEVIILTAHGGVGDAVKAMRVGAADFLEKPTTPEQLRLSVLAASRQRNERRAANQSPPAPRPRRADVSYSETLVRLQHCVWNSDISHTEQILAECLRMTKEDPTYYNVLGIVFEAEGHLQTAKTFYQKAQRARGGCGAADQNLQRLHQIETTGTAQSDVAVGEHAQFVTHLCAQSRGIRSQTTPELAEATSLATGAES